MGEKILRLVKPSWLGFRKNWQKQKMDKILKHMAMLKIKTRLNNEESALLKTKSNLMNDKSNFFVDDGDSDDSSDEDEVNVDVCLVDCDLAKFYNNATEVVRQFEARRPLSVVKLHNKEGFPAY